MFFLFDLNRKDFEKGTEVRNVRVQWKTLFFYSLFVQFKKKWQFPYRFRFIVVINNGIKITSSDQE